MGDRGIYVCRAENVAGTDQDWAVVEVERKSCHCLVLRGIRNKIKTMEQLTCKALSRFRVLHTFNFKFLSNSQ